MQALVVLVIILGASFIAYTILKEKKPHVDLSPLPEKTKKEEYPIVMSATVSSSSSSVLGKVETPEASPELIAAVVKTAAKPKPKKKVVKKEIAIKKERKPKDKGNDMLLS